MTDNIEETPVDPLGNLIKFLSEMVTVFLESFLKIFPIIGVGFIVILLILYLFFKLLGLA